MTSGCLNPLFICNPRARFAAFFLDWNVSPAYTLTPMLLRG